MKKFITTLALAVAVSVPAFAQQETSVPMNDRATEVKIADFERMLEAKYDIELRKVVINSLNLNEEQTEDFTPIFQAYMNDKDRLVDRRTNLVADYREEMQEDDTKKDEINETGDFIEDYMELDIRDLELRKDYFDRLEDAIGPNNALRFFRIESMFEDRLQRSVLLESIPSLIVLEPIAYSYEPEVKDFSNWKKINIDGKVGLNHEFTYTGLEKLLTAAETMVAAEGIYVPNFPAKKKAIMEKASMLKHNWKSNDHADHAKDAFLHTAKVLAEIADTDRFTISEAWISKLDTQAKQIKDNVLLTDQAENVYNFFDTAEYIVNQLVEQANDVSRK